MAANYDNQEIWIGIDPNLLVGGLDTRAFFGCENFLSFNIKSLSQKTCPKIDLSEIEQKKKNKEINSEIVMKFTRKKS